MNKRVTVDFDEESYYLDGEYWTSWDHYGEQMAEDINKLLDKQDKQIKELEKENENQNNILEDFMVMLNRLQADPNNKSLQSMAKDMLRMMGKDIIGDSE